MSHALITANVTHCVNADEVELAESARPYIERWLRENGYVKRTP